MALEGYIVTVVLSPIIRLGLMAWCFVFAMDVGICNHSWIFMLHKDG